MKKETKEIKKVIEAPKFFSEAMEIFSYCKEKAKEKALEVLDVENIEDVTIQSAFEMVYNKDNDDKEMITKKNQFIAYYKAANDIREYAHNRLQAENDTRIKKAWYNKENKTIEILSFHKN